MSELTTEEFNNRVKIKRRKGAKLYRIFLLSWILCLIVVLVAALKKFDDYLVRFEAAYRATLPEYVAGDLLTLFRTEDTGSLYDLATVKPEHGIYETREDLIIYLRSFLHDGEVSLEPVRAETTEDHKVFLIDSGDMTIARAEFVKEPVIDDLDIPEWNLTSLILYCDDPGHIHISAPDNVSLMINGIEYSGEGTIGMEPPAQRFIGDYEELPRINEYEVDGFYYLPDVAAISADGTNLPVLCDMNTHTYYVDYPRDSAYREEVEELAKEAVGAYANFVSGDLPEGELRKYFTANNIFLYYMEHAELKWFTRHRASEIHSAEVVDFIAYSDDVCYCEVIVEQYLTMEWGPNEPEVITTDGKFYFVKQNGEWKVLGIEF
ncbi:MAG: hypothetical protein J6I66_04880 [Lachnospiraceae bacterium]|nr:hypothetical protein [Clostridiales bacterium]MBP3754172.1 hypothetical protein [Lachnospiraceae bacterium]